MFCPSPIPPGSLSLGFPTCKMRQVALLVCDAPSAWGWFLSAVSGSLLGCQRRPLVAIIVHATWEQALLLAWPSESLCLWLCVCVSVYWEWYTEDVSGLGDIECRASLTLSP